MRSCFHLGGRRKCAHLNALVQAIQPWLEATRDAPGDRVHNCVIANARGVAGQIRASEPILKDPIQKNGVKVVAADYALDSGKVIGLVGPSGYETGSAAKIPVLKDLF